MGTELTGASQYIQWVYLDANGAAAGTLDLATDFRTFGKENTIRSVDASAGADQYVTYLPTLRDGSYRMTFLHNGGTTLWTGLNEGTQGTLTWGEAGTATNKPKHVQGAFIETANLDTPYDNVQIWNLAFRPMSARADSAWS